MEGLMDAVNDAGNEPASNPLTDPENPVLDGNSFSTINNVSMALLILVPILPALGALVEWACCRNKLFCKEYRQKGYPGAWVIILLAMSYALLIPGLVGPLFSFNIVANILVHKIGLGPDGGLDKIKPTTESMFGLLSLLHETGSDLGVLLVLTYAVLIPVAKILLLLAGECLRGKSVVKSMRCVQIVQNISKWACPDMFAYVLLMYLIRGLNHPMLLRAAGRLDLGFTCFSIFCIGSTVAAIGIQAKDKEKKCWKCLAEALGKNGVLLAVVLSAGAFIPLMVLGMTKPIMALRVDMNPLYSDNGGPIDSSQKEIIDMLDIPSLCHSDVDIVQSMAKLAEWIRYGEVNSFIGFVLLAVFAVGFTILDMIVLVFCIVCLRLGVGRKYSPLKICWVLKKLSMLDVTIMGVIVVTLCMAMYRDKGVIVYMGDGLWQLTGAELLHYLCYYLVKGAMQYYEPEANFAAKSIDSDMSGSDSEASDSSEEQSDISDGEAA